ncbi:MAG: asparagine synthase (glutamine-hydrolyzing) [Planctomycetes bacterium]|nr:asparagine synthase (glutamine-hydrolyzing) [Planctomycetota bacterium]
MPLKSIADMTQQVRHRGPDDEGYALFGRRGEAPQLLSGADTPAAVATADLPYAPRSDAGRADARAAHVAFGHRRLAIVDLSPAGHQPLCDATGRYWIVYNGEVYNHGALRAELERLGRRFHSATDTEVVVNAWAEWGPACQHRFNGMWAFLIYDTHTRRLHGSRDRFGIKPLYYAAVADAGWAFASEIKQFTVLPGWRPRMQWQQAYDFLVWGLVDHSDQTLFEGVVQLPAGGWFELETNASGTMPAPVVRRWYQIPRGVHRLTDVEAAAKLRDLLSDSVRLRLRADVPVGSCLSGGLDSSSIVCLANEQLRAQGRQEIQNAVSSYCDTPGFDEQSYVQQVVQRTGIRLHTVSPDPAQLFETLERLTWHQDGPFGSSSIFAQWCVFEEARRRRLLVMLDGQGADEQLAGYPAFFGAWLAELLIGLRWSTLGRELAGLRRREIWGLGYSLRQMVRHLPLPAVVKRLLHRRIGTGATAIFEWIDQRAFEDRGVSARDSLVWAYSDGWTVRDKALSQMASRQLPALLRYEDRNSMAHSVESRVPFLDYRLVEFLLSLPGEAKIRGGRTKFVLREAMRGCIPDAIVERDDKIAFGTPEALWFRGSFAAQFGGVLREAADLFPDILDRTALERHWQAVVDGRRAYDGALWRLASLGVWAKRFGIRDGAATGVARAA